MIKLDPGEKAVIEALADGGAEIRGGETSEPPPDPPPGGLTHTVNLSDYTVGDGVTDDTEGVQRAYDAAVNGCLVYDHRGPFKCTRKILIKGNMLVRGQGGGRHDWYGDGGIGVSENVGGIAYLRIEGLEVNNQSGDGMAIGLGLNELNNRGYPGGPSCSIDVAVVLYNKCIRSKILMNSKPGRMWLCDNLIESSNLELDAYAVLFEAPGSHNPEPHDTPDNGFWFERNNVRVLAKVPQPGFGADSDIIKVTGGMTRGHIVGNKIECLRADVVEGQIDLFTGGGRVLFAFNELTNTNLHIKQSGGHGGLQSIKAYKMLQVVHNQWDWTTSLAGFWHCPIFFRGTGLSNISDNLFNISATGRQVTAITCDNIETNVETGLGSASPRYMVIGHNIADLQGRDDHRLLEVQPPTGTGPAAFYGIEGNIVASPASQNTATAALGSAHRSVVKGNISPNSPAWSAGPGSVVDGNIFR